MNKQAFSLVSCALSLCLVGFGCSSSSDEGDPSDDNGGSGGSGARGGTGASSGETGGATTGGSSTSGGASSGGTSSGGAATGGNATGGAGGGSGGCEAACARVVGAACGTTTQAECVAGCNALTTSCAAEVPPYTECVSNPANAITCDTTAMAAEIAGCDAVIQDLSVCGICISDSTDMQCGTCTRGTCCEELQAYARAADVTVFDACVTSCTDSACVDACAAASPIAGAAYEAVGDCQLGSCGEECVCEASSDDTTCVACLKVGCCSDLVPYATAPDIEGFATCVEPCADQPCVDDCVAEFPEAGNAYATLIGCAEGSCLTECSQ